MESTLSIALFWGIFAASHMGLSSLRLRPHLVAHLGERGFLALYSLVAFAVFVPLCVVYARHRHEGALLWALEIPDAGLYLVYALQALAWTLILASFVSPSPAALGGPTLEAGALNPLHRITRHPAFGGVGLFGALHLPFMGFASDVVFWAGFPLFGVLGCWHQDRRKRASEGAAFETFVEQTPFWIRPTPGALRALPLWIPVAGIAVTVGLRLAHRFFSTSL